MGNKNYIEEVLLIISTMALITYFDRVGLNFSNFGAYSFESQLLLFCPIVLLILAVLIFYKKNYSKK